MSIKSQLIKKHGRLLTKEDQMKVFEGLGVKEEDIKHVKMPKIKGMKLRIWR